MSKRKIAILGGGAGALSAAFALTETPALREKLDVTVYQMGFRLGGKGASGRNAAMGQRIEEHGLHIWMGFYENAFRVMRACYEELGRPKGAPLATWDEAFKQQSYVVIQEKLPGEDLADERWSPIHLDFPTNSELPGESGELPEIWTYLELIGEWLVQNAGGLNDYDPLRNIEDAISEPADMMRGAAETAADTVMDAAGAAVNAAGAAATNAGNALGSAVNRLVSAISVAGAGPDDVGMDRAPDLDDDDPSLRDKPVRAEAVNSAPPAQSSSQPGWPAWVEALAKDDGSPKEPIKRGRGIGTVAPEPIPEPKAEPETRSPSNSSEQDKFKGDDPPVEVEMSNDILLTFQSAALEPLKSANGLIRKLKDDPSGHTAAAHHAIVFLLRAFRTAAKTILDPQLSTDLRARTLWTQLNLAVSTAIGILTSDALFAGWDCLDDMDFREFLRANGADDITVDSGFIRAVYDLVFAYEGGEIARPSIAAGVALRGVLRMIFTYKGSFFWEMQAGMGDVVFTPLYEVLKKRGVKFEFFHRVRALRLTQDQRSIGAVELTRQVELKGPSYEPLVDVKGLPSWPSKPLYDQIKGGDDLARSNVDVESSWSPPWRDERPVRLERGKDFDDVVLGIAIGALPSICADLARANEGFRAMLAHVKTVQTCAIQLWLKPKLEELGWTHQTRTGQRPVLTAFVEPIDTWADMSHLIAREAWPEALAPQTIAYFCGPFLDAPVPSSSSDHRFPERERQRFEWLAVNFLNYHVGKLWPSATRTSSGEAFKWEDLIDPHERRGQARFQSQYVRVNIEPTERYVLSLPGSTRYRLAPDGSGFENLYLAGDWTKNGINAGCVEAAVISGLWAARGLSGASHAIPGERDVRGG